MMRVGSYLLGLERRTITTAREKRDEGGKWEGPGGGCKVGRSGNIRYS